MKIRYKQLWKIERGGLWEESYFKIATDYIVDDGTYSDDGTCPHCYKKEIMSDSKKVEVTICPMVIIATNEGGYNSTGLCAECVYEELKKRFEGQESGRKGAGAE